MLAVELFSGECFFAAQKVARSQQVAQYFADVCVLLEQRKYRQVHIFLDQSRTHKEKMMNIFKELSRKTAIGVTFHLMATYSPKLNLVEYLIHAVRQRYLHHADCNKTMEQIEDMLLEKLNGQRIFTQEQIINTLAHIEQLVRST